MNFFRPTYIIAVLIAVAVHEWAHAITARKLGDPTAENAGRLTLNPLSHLDPIGSLLFVLVGFGWAKPVPVDPQYFRNPTKGMALTAIMGPVSNIILAFLSFVGILLISGGSPDSVMMLLDGSVITAPVLTLLLQILRDSLFVNLALMAFNLLPIAPLDGSNVLRMFIPYHLKYKYEDFVRIGPFILLFLLLFESFLPVQILSTWILGIMQGVLSVFDLFASVIL